MSFAMAPYLLGFKGPAQCIEFEPKPMKVHVVTSPVEFVCISNNSYK